MKHLTRIESKFMSQNFFPRKTHLVLNKPILTACLLSYCAATLAEEQDINEQYYLQEFPVVLSASRLPQPLNEAPNAMTVIDREMIKASGFRTIPDLFRLVPGMYVSFFTGNDPIVAYHGTTDQAARRMQVLVDGRAIHMPPMEAVAWEDLPLQIDDIERIEVIRGPAAASHGGNSTQGVLNIITRDAGAAQGITAKVTEGNAGISDAYFNIGKRGETLDYRISFGYRSDYGYDSNHITDLAGNDSLNNDSHLTHLFNLRSNYHPNAVDSVDIQLGYSDGTRGDGTNKINDPNIPHDHHNNENFEQISWTRSLAGGDEVKLQYYHIYQSVLNSLPANPLFPLAPLPALDDGYTNTRDDLELQHTLQTSSSNRLVWGASVRYDWTAAPARFLDEQTLQQSTLFAHDEWRITPQWLLNTGAMQEDNGMGQQNLSPRVALIHKFTEKQTVRLGISKAYRNPSLYEERGNYHFPAPIGTLSQSSGGLRPESVLSREIGYLGEFPELGFSIDTRLYHDQLSDIIYETDPPSGTPRDFINSFDAEHNGLEVTTKHQWGDRNQLTFNYTYQVLSSTFSGPADTNINYPGTPYSDTMPRNMISALYSRKFANQIAFSLGYYQQDTMLPIDRGPADRQYFTSRWDMRIAKGFKSTSEGTEGEIALVVQGLLGEHYIDYLIENQFNQRVYLTATLKY
jgi:iron complex outermembrane receptor protein